MVLHGGAFFPLSLLVRAGWLNPREIARRRKGGGDGEEKRKERGRREREEEVEEEKRRRRERRGEEERRRGGEKERGRRERRGEKERGRRERKGDQGEEGRREKVTTTGSYCTCVDYRLLPFLVSMRFLYRQPYSLRENPRQTLSIVHCSQSKG